MKETIIIAPSANNSELLRTLAKFGRNTLGVRIFSRTELAKYALMHSGVSVTEAFLTSREMPSVIYSFLKEIDYFKAASFADAENLSSALMTMRALIPSDEAEVIERWAADGEFPVKNEAIREVYERYIRKCSEDTRIDSIGLVRRAIKSALYIPDAEFLILREYPLMPLDYALLNAVSAGQYKEISLIELCGKERLQPARLTFTEGYGQINEVERILEGIMGDGIPFDKCVIAASNTSIYSQIFYDLSCAYGIPVTYGMGVPILNSNPARLLKLIYEWKTTGYYGIDALRKILDGDAFNRKEFAVNLGYDSGTLPRKDAEEIAKMAGSIRLSFDSAENKRRLESLKKALLSEAEKARSGNAKEIKRAEYSLKIYGLVEKLAGELALGCTGFLSKYVLIRADGTGPASDTAHRIDQSAVSVITETLDAYSHYAPEGDLDEIIPDILSKTVCSENSREGCLHITSIAGALSCMRENLYLSGLDSSEFPGSPSEDYLLLDSDLLLLADADVAPTASNRIRRKVRTLSDVIEFAAACGVRTHLSYSGYSLSELKDRNPSSVLFSIFEAINPESDMDDFRNSLIKAPYFNSAISADRLIGDEYSKGAQFSFEDRSQDKKGASSALSRAWAPSALSNYLQCPRHFYLANILGIPEEESDDPFEILSAAVTGTMAHALMEKLVAENCSGEEFIDAASKMFDDALKKRPPVHPSEAAALKREFIRMMQTSYDTDPHNEVISSEEEYCFDHPSGIRIHGYPDRVERDEDGSYLIADFKTKRRIDHIQDDFDTCMQVIVYAWLCEQAGIDISSCEYRYLRKGRTVTCRYDDEMKDQLAAFLTDLRHSIENNDFPRNESADNCKYCKMAGICKWQEDDSEEEEG